MNGGLTGTYTGTGVNDNDVLFTSGDMRPYDTFMIMSTAGAVDVYGSLDGTNYNTAPLSLADLGAVTSDPVVVTVANRLYGFRGKYRYIRVLQNGATAATATLRYGNA
jgi:hypothetical protein